MTPNSCRTMASNPALTCSPEATTASYSRASCMGAACRHHSTSWLVVPAMADTTTATSWPASTSRLTCCATLRIRSRSATEVPPNFMTSRAISPQLRNHQKARIDIDGLVCGQRPGAEGTLHGEGRKRSPNDGRSGRSRALRGAGRRVVEPARQDAAVAQVQPGADRLYPGPHLRAVRARRQIARKPEGAAHSRRRLRRRAGVRAAGAAWRSSRRHRPGRAECRGGAVACRKERPCDRLPRDDRGGAGRHRRALRRGDGARSGRACRRTLRCSCGAAPRW